MQAWPERLNRALELGTTVRAYIPPAPRLTDYSSKTRALSPTRLQDILRSLGQRRRSYHPGGDDLGYAAFAGTTRQQCRFAQMKSRHCRIVFPRRPPIGCIYVVETRPD